MLSVRQITSRNNVMMESYGICRYLPLLSKRVMSSLMVNVVLGTEKFCCGIPNSLLLNIAKSLQNKNSLVYFFLFLYIFFMILNTPFWWDYIAQGALIQPFLNKIQDVDDINWGIGINSVHMNDKLGLDVGKGPKCFCQHALFNDFLRLSS